MSKKVEEKVKVHLYKASAIDAAIVKLSTDATSMRNRIHSLAVSIVKVWHDAKGNTEAAKVACDRLNALQQASPYHANSFSKWVAEFLPLHWAEETNVWYVNTADETRVMGKTFMAARDTPFWVVSPAAPPKPFIMLDKIKALLAQCESRIDKPKEGDEVNTAALKHLREAVKAITPEPEH